VRTLLRENHLDEIELAGGDVFEEFDGAGVLVADARPIASA
jgi:hypothetical protein